MPSLACSHAELLLKLFLPFNSHNLEAEGGIKIDPEFGYEFSHTLKTQIKEWSGYDRLLRVPCFRGIV